MTEHVSYRLPAKGLDPTAYMNFCEMAALVSYRLPAKQLEATAYTNFCEMAGQSATG